MDKIRAEVDQSTAFLVETQPMLWWGLYQGAMKQGFTEKQAIDLVKTQISALAKGSN